MADDLVMVSVKMPRSLYARLQAYAKAHRYSVSELLRDGVEWRLGEEADPLAYRFGKAGQTSTMDTISDVDLLVDQDQTTQKRHQEIIDLLREIQKHLRAQPPTEPLPAPVGVVIPVIPPAPAVADAPEGTVIPVIPPEAPADMPMAPVISVIPPDTLPSFDTGRFYLGTLCPKGHNYHGAGMSLLRKHNQRCRECDNASKREKRAKKRQEVSA